MFERSEKELTVERATLSPSTIDLTVRNVGPDPVTVAQVFVNDAYADVRGGDGPVAPLSPTTLRVDYGSSAVPGLPAGPAREPAGWVHDAWRWRRSEHVCSGRDNGRYDAGSRIGHARAPRRGSPGARREPIDPPGHGPDQRQVVAVLADLDERKIDRLLPRPPSQNAGYFGRNRPRSRRSGVPGCSASHDRPVTAAPDGEFAHAPATADIPRCAGSAYGIRYRRAALPPSTARTAVASNGG